MELAQQTGFVAFLLVLIRQGFTASNPSTFLSWPMFSNFDSVRMDLREKSTGASVNMWSFFRHMDYALQENEIDQFLGFLQEEHDIRVDGMGVCIRPGRGQLHFVIQDSRVAR